MQTDTQAAAGCSDVTSAGLSMLIAPLCYVFKNQQSHAFPYACLRTIFDLFKFKYCLYLLHSFLSITYIILLLLCTSYIFYTYIQVIQQMLPYFYATGHFNYTKSALLLSLIHI